MADIWKNPFQRFGFVIVNVLIGEGVEERDRELFFGPVHPNDVWYVAPPEARGMHLPQLLVRLGLFDSAKDAERRGWRGPIPHGWSDHTIGRAKHRVSILKVLA